MSVVLLGGSGVVISRVRSALTWVISIVTLLITLLITAHEPRSTLRVQVPNSHILPQIAT